MTTTTPTLRPVARLTERNDPDGLTLLVDVVWEGHPLDRPDSGGWGFSEKSRDLAERLVRAINAGVVFHSPRILTDVNGKTYVDARTTEFFHGRWMRKSLKKVGF